MLKPETVTYKHLLLDPNNPRLAENFGSYENVVDDNIDEAQPKLESLFGIPPEVGDSQEEVDRLIGDTSESTNDDFFSIKDLKNSMRRIGFVGIQNIIVRKIRDSGKYLVIEGNRRVASIKAVLREHEKALPGTSERIEDEGKLNSLKDIQVMVLQTEGLNSDQIEKLISTTLGLRHYGSLLKWELLPRAKNIYDEYIKAAPDPFEYTTQYGKQVAEVMAIETSETKRLLRGYICYKQLCKMYKVKPHHFSIILAAIENTHLTTHGYFAVDDFTFKLLGDTAGKIDKLCEFEERDRTGFNKTIDDPKQFRKLGLMLKDSKLNQSRSIRNYAQGLFSEVVQKHLPLNSAYTELVGFKKKQQWTQAIQKLLDKQANDKNLQPEKFLNAGQELELRDKLRWLVKKYIAVSELKRI